jgi:hypothetical protein
MAVCITKPVVIPRSERLFFSTCYEKMSPDRICVMVFCGHGSLHACTVKGVTSFDCGENKNIEGESHESLANDRVALLRDARGVRIHIKGREHDE